MIAVGTPMEPSRPLRTLLLEEAIRQLDRVLRDEGVTIRADHPEDAGIDSETAALVAELRASE